MKHSILRIEERLEVKADAVMPSISTTTKQNKRLPPTHLVVFTRGSSNHEQDQPEESHTNYDHSELAHALAASLGISKRQKHPNTQPRC
jgi:hypothetical protein